MRAPGRAPLVLRFESFATPLGLFSVAVDADGAVVATAFGDEFRLRAKIPYAKWLHAPSATAEVRRQVEDYLRGERRDFSLRLAVAGTSFQQRVWAELRKIPHGRTATYGEIAETLGSRGASRAVGRANATNPICVIVPCHRVIGADGSLTGFAYGEDLKRKLLKLEGALA